MALFKVEPTLEVEFKVLCNECRAELTGDNGNGEHAGYPYVYLNPCEACLQDKYDEGYAEGVAKAEEEHK